MFKKLFLLLFLLSCGKFGGDDGSGNSSSNIANPTYGTFLNRVKNNEFNKSSGVGTSFTEYTLNSNQDCENYGIFYWCTYDNNNASTYFTRIKGLSGDKYTYSLGNYFDKNPTHSFEAGVKGSVTEAALLNLMVNYVQNATYAWYCGPNSMQFQVGDDNLEIRLDLPLHLNPVYRYNYKKQIFYTLNGHYIQGYCQLVN